MAPSVNCLQATIDRLLAALPSARRRTRRRTDAFDVDDDKTC